MRIIAGYVCALLLLGSIGLMVPQTVETRSRKKTGENGELTSERQEELRERIQALEREKRELEKLHAAQIRRDRRMKNVKMVDAEEVWQRCSVEVKAIDAMRKLRIRKGTWTTSLKNYKDSWKWRRMRYQNPTRD